MPRASLLLLWMLAFSACGAEERIRGILEKTARPDACAQIIDALDDIYYIAKSDAAEKMIAAFVGRNIVVVVTGNAAGKPAAQGLMLELKSVAKYVPAVVKEGDKPAQSR